MEILTRKALALAALAALAGLLLASNALASGASKEPLRLDVLPVGFIIEDGLAATAIVRVRCQPPWQPLEVFFFILQEPVANEDIASFPVFCDGKPRRFRVRNGTFSDSPPYRQGPAAVSLFVLLEDPDTGESLSVSLFREIRLVGGQ